MMRHQTEEDQVRETAERLGVSLAEARFIVAIERGEIDGDEVVIEPGEEIPE